MVGMLVPLKGGIGGIFDPPIGRKNTTCISLIVLAFWGLYNPYHRLGEPETTIDFGGQFFLGFFFVFFWGGILFVFFWEVVFFSAFLFVFF